MKCSFYTAQLTHSKTGIQYDIISWTFIIYTWIRKRVCNLSPSWQYRPKCMKKWAVEFSGYGFQCCTSRGASGARSSVLDIVGGFMWHQKLKQLHHHFCKTFLFFVNHQLWNCHSFHRLGQVRVPPSLIYILNMWKLSASCLQKHGAKFLWHMSGCNSLSHLETFLYTPCTFL